MFGACGTAEGFGKGYFGEVGPKLGDGGTLISHSLVHIYDTFGSVLICGMMGQNLGKARMKT